MAYGTLKSDVVQSSTAGTPPQFNDGNGTQVGTLCRAWVNFNGTTSPGTIRASFNVGSVTKNGTGDYTVNFTTAMSDANYSVGGIIHPVNAGEAVDLTYSLSTAPTSSALRINTTTGTNGSAFSYDSDRVTVEVFR